jgi:hypothetical protein
MCEIGILRDDGVASSWAGRIRLNMHRGHKTRNDAAEYQKSCQNASRSFSHTMRTILVARMLQAIHHFAIMQGLFVCCLARSACADYHNKYNANIEKSDAHSGVNAEARMPLAGDLSGFSVDEVVLFIMRGGKSGRLVLKDDAAESSLYFDAGAIVEVIHDRVHGPVALVSALAAFSAGQFTFYEGEQIPAPSMRVDESQLSSLSQQTHIETDTMAPVLPDVDEKLTLMLSFADPLSLTPLQWLLLAQIPQRCTLRHLSEGRDPFAVRKALSPLLLSGLVRRTGQIMSAGIAGVRLSVVKGYTREEEAVELDQEIIAGWRASGVFVGRVLVGGHVFTALARQGLGKSIVMSASACRLCGVRDTQEVDVTPAP